MSRKKSRLRVGAKLRKARERRGISLRQVADATKISVPVLQALERDDISYLPGGVVGRGFVRSFATAVNLDPEAIVAEFLSQFPHESVNEGYRQGRRTEEPPKDDRSRSQVRIRLESASPLRVAAIGLVAAMLAVFVYFAMATPTAWLKSTENRSTRVAAEDDVTLSITRSVPLPALAQTYTHSIPSIVPLMLSAVSSDSAAPAESAATSGEEPANTETRDPL
jgi:cytoskeletal protein RodZ